MLVSVKMKELLEAGVHFGHQTGWVDDHAGPEVAGHAVVDDPRRHDPDRLPAGVPDRRDGGDEQRCEEILPAGLLVLWILY